MFSLLGNKGFGMMLFIATTLLQDIIKHLKKVHELVSWFQLNPELPANVKISCMGLVNFHWIVMDVK